VPYWRHHESDVTHKRSVVPTSKNAFSLL